MMKKPETSKDAAIFSFMAGVMPPMPQDVWLIHQQLPCLTIIYFRPPYGFVAQTGLGTCFP